MLGSSLVISALADTMLWTCVSGAMPSSHELSLWIYNGAVKCAAVAGICRGCEAVISHRLCGSGVCATGC